MPDFSATITTVGEQRRAALEAAGQNALVASMEVGSGQYTPDGTETALMTPFSPSRTFSTDFTAHVTGEAIIEMGWQDPTDDVYNIGEIGLFLSDGTLYAVASQPVADGFLDVKTGGATFTIANLIFSSATLTNVTFPASSTAVIHGTTANAGIVRLGTGTENRDPDNEVQTATPKGVHEAVWSPPFASAVENLNNYTTPGIFALDDVDTIANSPAITTGGQTGVVKVTPLNGTSPQSNLIQDLLIGYPPASAGAWQRFRIGGTWMAWYPVRTRDASLLTTGMLDFARLPAATEAEAERANSSDNDSVMSPYRTRQTIAAWWTALTIAASKIPGLDASKIISGMLDFARLPAATEAEAERANSSDNDSVMSPYRTTAHFEARIKIQSTQPVDADGDSALSQIWLVHP